MTQRQMQQRKRTRVIAVSLVIAILGAGIAFIAFTGGNDNPAPVASGTPTPSPSATTSPSASPPTKLGTVTGTVTPVAGPTEVACGAKAPKDALTPKPQFNGPAQVTKKGAGYTATFETSCGTVVVKLLNDSAPQTVNNFVFLAQQGYFDGQRFHRIDTSIDVVQGGSPTGDGTGGPGYQIPDELATPPSYAPGVLAMANAGANTGGSQFFFITGSKGHLLDSQGAWTVFGQVTQGMDVLQTIAKIPISDPTAAANGDLSGQQPSQAVYIDRLTVQQT
jgi:cyclophilin family peptidyl-prolyl cis-trans isomerase